MLAQSKRLRYRNRALHVIGTMGTLLVLVLPGAGDTADVEAGRRHAAVCAPCHGADGNSTNPSIPSLAAQPPLYTYYQLLMFRGQQRSEPQMSPLVMSLSDTDMQDIAAYYTVQTPAVPPAANNLSAMAAGQQLVQAYYCNSCHAPGLLGQKHIPRLAGQQYQYLLQQLRAFKAQTRADLEGSMTMAAQPLSTQDIETLAYYLAHLSPVP